MSEFDANFHKKRYLESIANLDAKLERHRKEQSLAGWTFCSCAALMKDGNRGGFKDKPLEDGAYGTLTPFRGCKVEAYVAREKDKLHKALIGL